MIKLYELRLEKGLSQRQIAKMLNISQSTYNNWENSRTEPSIAQLIQIAQLFGVSVDFLIGNTDDMGNIVYSNGFLTSTETELIRLFKSLPEPARKNILDFMKNINL